MALVELRRRLEERVQAVSTAATGLESRSSLFVFELHPVTICQPFDRGRELEPLGLPHELDQVASFATGKAVVELLDGVHREAGVLVVVEWRSEERRVGKECR